MRGWRLAHRSVTNGKTIRTFSAFHHLAGNPPRRVANYLYGSDNAIDDASVQGWVKSVRKQKKVAFAAINDGSTTKSLQAVLTPEDAANLSAGTAVKLSGKWASSMGKGQSHEFQVSKVDILGENDAEHNPLQPKFQTLDYLRTIPHLRARIPTNNLVLRLRSQLIAGLTRYFDDQGFVQVHTPIFTSSDCEGAGEVFTVAPNDHSKTTQGGTNAQVDHFFRQPKYLTVSAQLHLEALSQAVDKVWTLSPTFRAEKSDTPRHLSEFYMLEAEVCFADSLDHITSLVENMLRSTVQTLQSSRTYEELIGENREQSADAETIRSRWDGMASESWPRITYTEAIALLESAHAAKPGRFEFAPSYDTGLQAEHERFLATEVGLGKPVFVTDYPLHQKPFYMLPSDASVISNGTAETAACFDLLVPDLCELVGGSLREHRSHALAEAMQQKGVGGRNLEWYQDLRRYGSVPHGGFGLGFDRLLCYLSGVSNIRDVVAFPRWYGRCDC